MVTYLITGGCGFIGANFIHYILEKYDDILVINFDKLTYAGNLQNVKDISKYKNYIFIKGDIANKKQVESVFSQYKIDYVVNFAAESHVDRSIKNPLIFTKTNVLGVGVLLEIAKKHWQKDGKFEGKKFIQISTDEVYGSIENGKFKESSPITPTSPYSASKASAELIVLAYYKTYNFPINITRSSNNYGMYQHVEKFIPKTIMHCLTNKPIEINGNGNQQRDWLYVLDNCEAIDTIINKAPTGEIYNIGGNNVLKNIEVANSIISIFKKENNKTHFKIEYKNLRATDDFRYALDCSKIKKELNWSPKNEFLNNLILTINYYKIIKNK